MIAADFVTVASETPTEYAPAAAVNVKLHDGSIVRLRKMAPNDREAATADVERHRAKGEVPAGLFFVDSKTRDMHHSGTTEVPRSQVPYEKLCPGRAALDELRKSFSLDDRRYQPQLRTCTAGASTSFGTRRGQLDVPLVPGAPPVGAVPPWPAAPKPACPSAPLPPSVPPAPPDPPAAAPPVPPSAGPLSAEPHAATDRAMIAPSTTTLRPEPLIAISRSLTRANA